MSEAKPIQAPLAPGGTIGILGGGQLGRMLCIASAKLGFKTHVYSLQSDAPAFAVCALRTQAPFEDKAALEAFAKSCDVVTFEFENIPAQTIEWIAAATPVNPSAKTLRLTQDRVEEKTFAKSLGLKTAPFIAIHSPDDAAAAFAKIGASAILKTRRMGYDGKGQMKIGSTGDLVRALAGLEGAPAILEGFVDFAFEVSVIAARGMDGSFAAYDPPENIHEHHILRRSIVPSRLSPAQCDDAKTIAKTIADALDYAGVLAVELFVAKDGTLLVNEIAPRVHNSGHWTLDACAISQFEQHIRAVAGWPLGDPARHSNAVMHNIIGEDAADWQRLATSSGALHFYGKTEARPGRKMGHITHLSPKT